jgi:hypothetical protein
MHTTTRTQHGTTPVTDDAAAWLDRTYPEGDAYIQHDPTCDAASCGDECEGGCPVYVDDEPQPAPTAAAEHTCHGQVFCGKPRAAAQADCPACTPPAPARPLLEVLGEHVDQVRARRAVEQENAARSAELQQNAAVDRRVAELRADREAARRQALEQLAQHALPADAPGAWIRNAIDQELAADVAAGRACGDHDRPTPCSECQ